LNDSNNLKKAAPNIILSWAIPKQGGHGHVNERDNKYVKSLFKEYHIAEKIEQKLRIASGFNYFHNTIMVFVKKSRFNRL